MASALLNQHWHHLRPGSLRLLREDIEEHYPTLHLSIGDDDTARVAGIFPVTDADGGTIDRFEVRLDLPSDYPRSLPIVYETGGRIPWSEDRHINGDGTACVLMPEERHRIWPVGEPLSRYLDGPLRNFFLGQLARDHGDPWPFGEWAHGEAGFLEFIKQEIGSSDRTVVQNFLLLIQAEQAIYSGSCPCGSNLQTRCCCRDKVAAMRRTVSCNGARQLLLWLLTTPTAMDLIQTAGTVNQLASKRIPSQLLLASTSMPSAAIDRVT